MLPATFAMAPRHRFRLTGGHVAHGAAQAAAFELIAHAAELSASKLALHGKIVGKPVFLRLTARAFCGASPVQKGRRRPRSEIGRHRKGMSVLPFTISLLRADSRQHVRRILWPGWRRSATMGVLKSVEPTGFLAFAPAFAGTNWADVNRRIIQNCPHGRGRTSSSAACLVPALPA
jgi:hypothetical protein